MKSRHEDREVRAALADDVADHDRLSEVLLEWNAPRASEADEAETALVLEKIRAEMRRDLVEASMQTEQARLEAKEPTRELRSDRREDRHDRRELREDRRETREDLQAAGRLTIEPSAKRRGAQRSPGVSGRM